MSKRYFTVRLVGAINFNYSLRRPVGAAEVDCTRTALARPRRTLVLVAAEEPAGEEEHTRNNPSGF